MEPIYPPTTDSFIQKLAECSLFSDMFKHFLEKTGVSPPELASRIPVVRVTVHYWKTGERIPSRIMVLQIGAALGLIPDEVQCLYGAREVAKATRELRDVVDRAIQNNDLETVFAVEKSLSSQINFVEELLQRQKCKDCK